MKKTNILKSNIEFNKILTNIKPFRTKNFNIFVEKTNIDNYYFGFTVGKKIGNAVVRNKNKRRLKNMLEGKKFKNNFKCILMAKKDISDENYLEIKKELIESLEKLDLFQSEEEK